MMTGKRKATGNFFEKKGTVIRCHLLKIKVRIEETKKL